MSKSEWHRAFLHCETLGDLPDYKPNGRWPIFAIAKGIPRAYMELPQADGQIGRYVYHVLGFKAKGLLPNLERMLIHALFEDICYARAQLDEDYLPWIIERRAMETSQEGDFESNIIWSRITWRVCIPGVDMSLLRSAMTDGWSVPELILSAA